MSTVIEAAIRFTTGVDSIWVHLHKIEDDWKDQGIESQVVSEQGEIHEDALKELSMRLGSEK